MKLFFQKHLGLIVIGIILIGLIFIISFTEIADDAFSALFGAIGGAAAAVIGNIIIERKKENERTLADINLSIGTLSSFLNTLLNIKDQRIIPFNEKYFPAKEKFKRELREAEENPDKKFQIEPDIDVAIYPKIPLDLNIPTERIFAIANENFKVNNFIIQTNNSLKEVEIFFQMWNDEVHKLKNMPSGKEKCYYYFGIPMSEYYHDTFFLDTVNNRTKSVDNALSFIDKSIDALQKLGKHRLPLELHDNLIQGKMVDEKYKHLMPDDNHIPGWDI